MKKKKKKLNLKKDINKRHFSEKTYFKFSFLN